MDWFHIPYKNLIEVKEKSSYNLGSNDELLLATPTFKSKKTLGDRAFKVAARLHRRYGTNFQVETSLKPFKAKLKPLLFKEVHDL